jgi:hypothetical protein
MNLMHHARELIEISSATPVFVNLYASMEFKFILIFVCFSVALALLTAGATGRVYDFDSGRRGSGRVVATLTPPTVRFLTSFLGVVCFVLALFVAGLALVEWQRMR